MEGPKPSKEDIEYEIQMDAQLFIPYWITCAKSGCLDSARELSRLIAQCLKHDIDFPPSLKAFLSEAFEKIADGKSADEALLLRHGRGKNGTALYRKQAVAHEVRRLYWIGEARTVEEACATVAERGVDVQGAGKIFVDAKTAYKYFYELTPEGAERRPEK